MGYKVLNMHRKIVHGGACRYLRRLYSRMQVAEQVGILCHHQWTGKAKRDDEHAEGCIPSINCTPASLHAFTIASISSLLCIEHPVSSLCHCSYNRDTQSAINWVRTENRSHA